MHCALATKTPPYLLQTALTFSATCRSTKSTKNLFIAAVRDMSAALQNAAVQTNDEATDNDYFAFSDSADTEAASDITNKCDLELGSAAVSR